VDRDALRPVHGALAAKGLLPGKHLVDAGSVDADQWVASVRDHGVALVGPAPKDHQWQARTEGAFTVRDFTLDWNGQPATCPAGHSGQTWTANHNQGRTVMRIYFSTTGCKPCALKPRCTRAACSRRGGKRSTKRWKRPVRVKPENRLPLSTVAAPASKARCRKACGPCTCAAPAVSAPPRRTCSTCLRPRPSTCPASMIGSQAHHVHARAGPPSSASWPNQLGPDDFASSIKSGATSVGTLASECRRTLQLLERANIKLASVMSDVFGVSGRLMLQALAEGRAAPVEMADLAKRRLRRKVDQLCLRRDYPMSTHAPSAIPHRSKTICTISPRDYTPNRHYS